MKLVFKILLFISVLLFPGCSSKKIYNANNPEPAMEERLYYLNEREKSMDDSIINGTNVSEYDILIKSLDQILLPNEYFNEFVLEKSDEKYRNIFYDSVEYKEFSYFSKKNNKHISICMGLYPSSAQAISGLKLAIMTRTRPYQGPNFNIGDFMISADEGIYIFSRANVIVDIYADPGISMLSAGEDIDRKILKAIKE